jgi:hypothetical protein
VKTQQGIVVNLTGLSLDTGKLRMVKIKRPRAKVELIAFDPESLHQGDEQIAERHVVPGRAPRVDVTDMIKSSASNEYRQVPVGVCSPVSHATSEQHHRVV